MSSETSIVKLRHLIWATHARCLRIGLFDQDNRYSEMPSDVRVRDALLCLDEMELLTAIISNIDGVMADRVCDAYFVDQLLSQGREFYYNIGLREFYGPEPNTVPLPLYDAYVNPTAAGVYNSSPVGFYVEELVDLIATVISYENVKFRPCFPLPVLCAKYGINAKDLFSDNFCDDVVNLCSWLNVAFHDTADDLEFRGKVAIGEPVVKCLRPVFLAWFADKQSNHHIIGTIIDIANQLVRRTQFDVSGDSIDPILGAHRGSIPKAIGKVNFERTTVFAYVNVDNLEESVKEFVAIEDMVPPPSTSPELKCSIGVELDPTDCVTLYDIADFENIFADGAEVVLSECTVAQRIHWMRVFSCADVNLKLFVVDIENELIKHLVHKGGNRYSLDHQSKDIYVLSACKYDMAPVSVFPSPRAIYFNPFGISRKYKGKLIDVVHSYASPVHKWSIIAGPYVPGLSLRVVGSVRFYDMRAYYSVGFKNYKRSVYELTDDKGASVFMAICLIYQKKFAFPASCPPFDKIKAALAVYDPGLHASKLHKASVPIDYYLSNDPMGLHFMLGMRRAAVVRLKEILPI